MEMKWIFLYLYCFEEARKFAFMESKFMEIKVKLCPLFKILPEKRFKNEKVIPSENILIMWLFIFKPKIQVEDNNVEMFIYLLFIFRVRNERNPQPVATHQRDS